MLLSIPPRVSAVGILYPTVGYPKESIGYYFYNPTKEKVFVGRHAIFLEKEFIQEGGIGRSIELEEVQNLQSI